MNFFSYASLSLLFFLFLITNCGSTDTVKSKDINQESLYQHWSLVHQQNKNSVNMMAQFRVGGFTGTTVAFERSDQVLIDDKTAEYVDGDKVNNTMNILNFLSALPIFNLLKTGTFYFQNSDNNKDTYVGIFTDDDGRKFSYLVPKLTLTVEAPLPGVYKPNDELAVKFSVKDASASLRKHCQLKVRGKNEKGIETSDYFPGKVTEVSQDNFLCTVIPSRIATWEDFSEFVLEIDIDQDFLREKQARVNTSAVWSYEGLIQK